MSENSKTCSACILPADYPNISFDPSGRCNYCQKWFSRYQSIDFEAQMKLLANILSKYRGKTRPYDCLVGISGGKDSCYSAYLLKKFNMNPLGYTFDNGFLTESALENIHKTVDALSIGHIFVRPNPEYMKSLYRKFLLTTGEFCTVCNIGIRSALYRVARGYGIKLVVSGHSNRTEANSPKEFYTSSTGYFKNAMRNSLSKKEIYGHMYYSQLRRIFWHLTKTPFFLQMPSYVPWKEEELVKELEEKFNWQGMFGEQHKDCRMSDAKEYLKLKKFDVTEYTAKLSSLIRDNQMTKEQALFLADRQKKSLQENADQIQDQLRQEFDLSEEDLQKALDASHLPYISKGDSLLTKIKLFYESMIFKK